LQIFIGAFQKHFSKYFNPFTRNARCNAAIITLSVNIQPTTKPIPESDLQSGGLLTKIEN